MNEQSKRLLKIIQEADISYSELEKLTGIAKSSIQRYATGKTKKIPIDAVKLIADATNSSASWVMGWDDKDPLPAPTITNDFVTFPVIGEVAAGYEHIAVEDWEGDKINIPSDWLSGRPETDFFVLRIKGDSMYPEYKEGDKLLVLKQSTMDYSGQIGVVIYDTENATVKKIEYKQGENWMKLVPINPNYPQKRIENEELERCCVLGIPRILIREVEE